MIWFLNKTLITLLGPASGSYFWKRMNIPIPDNAVLISGNFRWPDGNTYTGEWNSEKKTMHGRGKYTWSDGSTYEGSDFLS